MLIAQAVKEISDIILSARKPLIIAIDGRCCAGKTTLGRELSKAVDCNIFKTDDFYPPFSARTSEQKANIDAQRFLEEVLLPLKAGKDVLYKPFSCKTGGFEKAIKIPFKNISVIEGCYCLHPLLREHYTNTFFITVDKETQQNRLKAREGSRADVFNAVWIKKEEEYFAACAPQDFADTILELKDF